MARIILSLIIFFSGILHLLNLGMFDSDIPFLLTGLIDIVLALGLCSKKFQDLSARLIALWILCLTPMYIYFSWNHIAIFGIVLLPAFYFWALSLQTKGWIMAQVWKDVLFLHYQVDPKILQAKVPFKLDLYNGHAVLSIVSFTMDRIRFPFLPSVPGLSKLNELNLRTYVEVDGIKGVYFFTLDADLIPAIIIARLFFSLPYHLAKISIQKNQNNYFCESQSSSTSLKFSAEIQALRKSSHFELWATERYGLFTQRSGHTLHGIVQHVPWSLQEIALLKIEDNFSTQLGEDLKATTFLEPGYCKELNVRFRPFYKMNSTSGLPLSSL